MAPLHTQPGIDELTTSQCNIFYSSKLVDNSTDVEKILSVLSPCRQPDGATHSSLFGVELIALVTLCSSRSAM